MIAREGYAWALRRRADTLTHHAETVADREVCRDARAEVDRLRGAAAHADQRARALEAVIGADRPRRHGTK